jgi:hypothetical protein
VAGLVQIVEVVARHRVGDLVHAGNVAGQAEHRRSWWRMYSSSVSTERVAHEMLDRNCWRDSRKVGYVDGQQLYVGDLRSASVANSWSRSTTQVGHEIRLGGRIKRSAAPSGSWLVSVKAKWWRWIASRSTGSPVISL